MTPTEVWDFVRRSYKMTVALTLDQGVPHATPVYFVDFDFKLYFRGPPYDRKMRRADGGKVCCVFEEGLRYAELRGVSMRGRSSRLQDPGRVALVSGKLAEKYGDLQWKPTEMPTRWVEQRRSEERVIIEVTPTIISSWDNRKIAREFAGPA